LHARGLETIGVSQSDEEATLDAINEHGLCFPQALDSELALSFALELEVVPALFLVDAGGEVIDRTDALELPAFTRVVRAAASLAGADEAAIERAIAAFSLPAFRPGCASRTLDADVAERRAVALARDKLAARRFEIGDGEDEHEALFERGLTDGLPVVPPS